MNAPIQDRLAESQGARSSRPTQPSGSPIASAKSLARRPGFPEEPRAQLRAAIEAVFRSWHSDRARASESAKGLTRRWGPQRRCRRWCSGTSTSGRARASVFHARPRDRRSAGLRRLPRAGAGRGRGRRDARGGRTRRTAGGAAGGPRALSEALTTLETSLPRHLRREFTVSAGDLYILQTRIGRRSPARGRPSGGRDGRGARIPADPRPKPWDGSTRRRCAPSRKRQPSIQTPRSSRAASPFRRAWAWGCLSCDPDRASELASRGIDVVLGAGGDVARDVHGMVGASGIVTTLGGVASHAAVVARSWAIPAVTSVAGVEVESTGLRLGDRFIAEGELVTVDGGAGTIYLGDQRQAATDVAPEVQTLRGWALELGVEPGTAVDGDAGRRSSGGRDAAGVGADDPSSRDCAARNGRRRRWPRSKSGFRRWLRSTTDTSGTLRAA